MKPADTLHSFRKLHAILKNLDIPHALIGGWAAVVWGVVRTTRDIDLLADIPGSVRTELDLEFRDAGISPEWRRGGEDDPIPELLRLTCPETWGALAMPIDIIIASRQFEREALGRATSIELQGWRAPVLIVEDLIAMKLAAGGPLDIQDARSLMDVHRERLDETLLRNGCARLKVLRLLKELRHG